MGAHNISVFGIYRDREGVERAVQMLESARFRNTDISFLFPENEGTKDLAVSKGTKAPEGTASGASAGAVVGGTLGWLVSMGALAIPGLEPLVAAGPIVATLAGVGAGGMVGGVLGGLIGFGVPEYEARRYEGQIRRGSVLMSVHCDSAEWIKRAKQFLRDTGAEDIASAGEASADFAKGDKPMPRRVARRVDSHPELVRPASPARRIDDSRPDDPVPLDTGDSLIKRNSDGK